MQIRTNRPLVLAFVVITSAACSQASVRQDATRPYLANAHSHNDYERAVPLRDALDRGFASIEVDIVLRDGELYVAHEEADLVPTMTLRRLYLDPLREHASRRGGWIHSSSAPPLQLLIDVKTEATSTYRALDAVLRDYRDLFTRWTPGGPEPGPVTAVLSGNRAVGLIRADALRYVAVDGRIDEERPFSADEMPLVSIDWEDVEGSTLERRLAHARELVARVHAERRAIRFWGTPDEEDLWSSLLALGVDYVGTDDPARLQRLLGRSTEATR